MNSSLISRQPAYGKGNKTLIIVLVVLAVLGVVCCGGGALLMWGSVSMVQGALGEVVEGDLRASDDVRAEIGEIDSVSMNFTKTGQLGENGVLVFDVKGTQGSGEVRARVAGDQVSDIVFITADGREIQVESGVGGFDMSEDEVDFEFNP